MQSLLKILSLFGDLVLWVIRIKQQEKRDEELKAVRSDPAGAFRAEFGGVPDNEAGNPQPVHGSEARAQVDTRQ